MTKATNLRSDTDIISILIILLVVPFLTIIMIYIQYAEFFDLFLKEYSNTGRIYSLNFQSNIFTSIEGLSEIIKSIGIFSIKSINIIFHLLILFRFISAIQQRYSFLIKELLFSIIIITIYVMIIAPGLNIFIQILGYLITIITCLIILLCVVVTD